MAMEVLTKGPILDWTSDRKLHERFLEWQKKVSVLCKGLKMTKADPEFTCLCIYQWSGERTLFHVELCTIFSAFLFSFSLSFSSFHVCQHIQRIRLELSLYFFFSSISVVNASCQTILPCNFPPNKHGRISIVGLRTDSRMDRSDVITKPKFFAFVGFPNFFSYGAPAHGAPL